MTVLDLARLDRIAAALPPEDAAFLAEVAALLDPRWKRRQRRLARRDDLVRAALAEYDDLRPCRAAEALAGELRRVSATPHATGDRATLLRRILDLSGNRPLAWRRIVDVAEAADA